MRASSKNICAPITRSAAAALIQSSGLHSIWIRLDHLSHLIRHLLIYQRIIFWFLILVQCWLLFHLSSLLHRFPYHLRLREHIRSQSFGKHIAQDSIFVSKVIIAALFRPCGLNTPGSLSLPGSPLISLIVFKLLGFILPTSTSHLESS